MATLIPFNPAPNANFQFQCTLDGAPYNVICRFNAYGQRYYVYVYDLNGVLVFSRPLIASPSFYNVSLTLGYFDTTMIYRESSQTFEIPGLPPVVVARQPRPAPPPPPPPPSLSYAQEIATDEPIIWWRMEDAPGSTTGTDSGPLNLSFTLTGTNDAFGGAPLWAEGASLVCAGSQYNAAIAAHNDALNFQGDGFTITALVEWNGSAEECTIVGHGQTNVDWANWDLFITPSGQVSMYLSSSNSFSDRVQFTSSETISVGPVYRIAARWSSDTGDVGLWINGARVVFDNWMHALWVASSPVGVGTFPHASGLNPLVAQFQGKLSEIAIYDYPLTDARISAQYNSLA